MADCSIAMVGKIEAGAVPRRSAVVDRIIAALGPSTNYADAANVGVAKEGDHDAHAPE